MVVSENTDSPPQNIIAKFISFSIAGDGLGRKNVLCSS